jgi:exonuclease SbcD
MSIKIVHSADHHIGMKFNSYPEIVRKKLMEERFLALKRIVDYGNDHKAHLLILTGDLFDSTTIKAADIKTTVSILNAFSGDAVWIIPGNHDFYQPGEDAIWEKLKKAKNEKIHVFDAYQSYGFEVNGIELVVYPCACRSKHSTDSVVGWVGREEKEKNKLHLGLAHGNVEGLGLDKEGKYFNMTREELASLGVDLWLLGHIHVPYPSHESVTTNPGLFMAATPTPDGWDRKHPGYCWYIEINDKKDIKANRVRIGGLQFYNKSFEINAQTDIDKLKAEINSMDKENSLVRIELKGRLGEAEIIEVEQLLQTWKNDFLHLELNNQLKHLINQAYINTHYIDDSLPHKLLTSLLEEDSGGISVQLANQLIERLQKTSK